MSVDNYTRTHGDTGPAPVVIGTLSRARMAELARRHPRHFPRPRRPKVRKLRLLLVLAGFGTLAVISMLFGALTSIASDLPQLKNTVQFSHTVDSYMYDATGRPIGPLAPASTPAIDPWNQISQNMVHAIVAVEDRGFWSESGISIRGLLRAALADLAGGPVQGASTIPEEFIKNVRQEEDHRTIAEKLVEAGLAFQLSHHWSHEKILTEYLNTIYFGNGALGIEAAARVYFGWAHGFDPANPAQGSRNGCGDSSPEDRSRRECASMLTPAQAAMLAAMVANPSAFNPAGTNAERAALLARRNDVVLKDMYEQHYLSYRQYQTALNTPLPTRTEIQQPQQQPTAAPYFTSWVEPLVVRALRIEGLSAKAAQYEAYYGGLKIKLSLNLNLQQAAQAAVNSELPPGTGLPSASLVAIDNQTGEVVAMVSGDGNYQKVPFNLATMGYRQPGSAFKLFTLAAALSKGLITPSTEFDSKPVSIPYPYKDGPFHFRVHNFANSYAGWIPMTVATAVSDNTVFAQLGMKVGTKAIAQYAKLMGIRSPVSTTPAMILGGLSTGVSALDLAHAYQTAANGGKKVFNPVLGDVDEGPIGIQSISGCVPCRQHNITNAATMRTDQVISPQVASTIDYLLHGPVDTSYGTGQAAAIPGVQVVGKTGTTTNYVDAWFAGWTPQLTVAVWVGYPNSGKAMYTQFKGGPVEGGTYPAVIWHNFQVAALQILQNEAQHRQAAGGGAATQTAASAAPATQGSPATSSTATTTTTAASTATTPANATGPTGATTTAAGTGQGSSAAPTETLPQSAAPPPAAGATTSPSTTATTPGTATSGGTGL